MRISGRPYYPLPLGWGEVCPERSRRNEGHMYRVPNLSERERLTVEALLDLIEEGAWRGADLAGEDLSDLDLSAPVLEAQWQARGFSSDKMPPWWSPANQDEGKPAGINLYRAQMEITVLRRAALPGAALRGAGRA